jgi:hypothetical protein
MGRFRVDTTPFWMRERWKSYSMSARTHRYHAHVTAYGSGRSRAPSVSSRCIDNGEPISQFQPRGPASGNDWSESLENRQLAGRNGIVNAAPSHMIYAAGEFSFRLRVMLHLS